MLLEGNLTGVQHLGVFVSDINHAKKWYVDTLGFEVVYEPTFDAGGEEYRLAFLERDGLQLELVLPPANMRADVAARTHGHIDHFAMDVIDAESALDEALQRGAQLDDSTPDGLVPFPLWEKGVTYVMLKGPEGEKVELNERHDLDAARREANLGGWSHLGVPTADIEASRAFYRDFGFDEALYAEIELDDGLACISMMELNGFMVELYQLPEFSVEALAALEDGNIDHIALDVADADAAYEALKQAGFDPLEDAPVALPLWENGVKYFNVRGPNGEKVEFNQVV